MRVVGQSLLSLVGEDVPPNLDPLDAAVGISLDRVGVKMWEVVALQVSDYLQRISERGNDVDKPKIAAGCPAIGGGFCP